MIKMSSHAEYKLNTRIPRVAGLTRDYIVRQVESHSRFYLNKTYIEVFKYAHVHQSPVDSSRGNVLVAVCENDTIKTLVLTMEHTPGQYANRIR